ncbi:toxin HipA [Bacteroidia bacterium]|nr:toxin HipA [Bacteroidia bacterium]
MKNATQKILVYADWENLNNQFIGTLYANFVRGKEIFSFEYDKKWLQSPYSQQLDPDLQNFSGIQYLREGKSNFGAFLDSSPDRWGRVLMERRESILARLENRQRKNLSESDFLLGVFDENRMGALRFKTEEKGNFLNDNRGFSTPPFSSIRDLEYAAYQLENENIENDTEILRWLSVLLAPGSSLGGARPKAGVKDEKGELWIAKFPSKNDNYDVGAWEMTVNELAVMAGVNVAKAQARKFYGKHHTFLTKRFDRNADKRIHCASAMTLLGYSDGAEGVSYLELAEFIQRGGANVAADLEELFRRIVLNICVSNTDDHLRNHGFLLARGGWTLSPAYDINPNPRDNGLKLNISETDNSLDLDLAKEVAPYFRLNAEKANKIIETVKNAVKNWQKTATKYQISREEQEYMRTAFLFPKNE